MRYACCAMRLMEGKRRWKQALKSLAFKISKPGVCFLEAPNLQIEEQVNVFNTPLIYYPEVDSCEG